MHDTTARESWARALFPTVDNCPPARGVASDRETKSQSVRADAVVRAGAVRQRRADGVERRRCTSTSNYHHRESCRLEPTTLGGILITKHHHRHSSCWCFSHLGEGRSQDQLPLHGQPVSCMRTDYGFLRADRYRKALHKEHKGSVLAGREACCPGGSLRSMPRVAAGGSTLAGTPFPQELIHLLREPREHERLHCLDAMNRNWHL